MRKATVENIDALVEFDVPFRLVPIVDHNEDVLVSFDVRAQFKTEHVLYTPEVVVDAELDDHGDLHELGNEPLIYGQGRWDFYSRGYTWQYGVKANDPAMHQSERVGGRLARDMIGEGGVFVITSVEMVFDGDDEYEGDTSSGWVVLRQDED